MNKRIINPVNENMIIWQLQSAAWSWFWLFWSRVTFVEEHFSTISTNFLSEKIICILKRETEKISDQMRRLKSIHFDAQ